MARAHDVRVAALCDVLGEEGICLARRGLFQVGVELGEEARRRLKVGETGRDLVAAARLLYRILGIHFRAEVDREGGSRVRIDRCALSRAYSPEACLVLSATDEGVVAGLHPGARLRFLERMTEGRKACLASLSLGAPRER